MRIIHLSYNIPIPNYTDPEAWLKRISFSVVVMESMATQADIAGIYHIDWKGSLSKNKVTYYFPGFNRLQLFLPFQFSLYLKKLKPDVVIVHGLIFPWQIIMLRWLVGGHVKIIAQHHAERPLRDIRQYFQKWADRYISAYLFSSVNLGQQWVDRGQIKHIHKVKVIIGTSSTFFPMEKKQAREVTKIPEGRIFLWVGRFDQNKDPMTLLKAFHRFAERHGDVNLYVIYTSYPNDLLAQGVIDAENIHSQIHLIGEIAHDDLLHWYNSADFILSSSHYEGSGVAVCEALSCGCVPILTDIPSFQMMSDEGKTGILYPAGNTDMLYGALEKSLLLDHIAESKKALAHYNLHLSPQANARKIMEVIQETA